MSREMRCDVSPAEGCTHTAWLLRTTDDHRAVLAVNRDVRVTVRSPEGEAARSWLAGLSRGQAAAMPDEALAAAYASVDAAGRARTTVRRRAGLPSALERLSGGDVVTARCPTCGTEQSYTVPES